MTDPAIVLERLRETSPLVQCITNYVAMNVAANVMLAVGASPAMVHAPEESAEFAAISSALTVNIGTLSADWVRGMTEAVKSAAAHDVPWVLDPVAHFATGFRRQTVRDLLAHKPTIVRGNASEIIALAGGKSAGRGVDSGDPVDLAENAARDLATTHKTVVALTGPVDFVTDGQRAARIHGGSAMMPRVTALGCSLTAVMGATLAVNRADPLQAAVAALAIFAAAGSRAAGPGANGRGSSGPGSFAVNFVDALYSLNSMSLHDGARIEWL